MKAVVVHSFGPLETLVLEDIAPPEPQRGELVIDVAAAEVNFPDILVIEGKYQVKPPLPFSPGKGAAGRVAAIGAGVSGFSVGDRVALQVEYGAFAEQIRARAENCMPLPDGIGFDTAAALGLAYQTAWFALTDRANLQAGETVLVLGASGAVGLATIELAKALGSATVIAALRGGKGWDLAQRAGADNSVDISTPDVLEGLREQVRAITGGRGVDIIVDSVGGAAAAAAIRSLGWRGRMIVVGFAGGEIPTFNAGYLLVKNIAVLGLQVSDYRDRTPARMADAQRTIFDLYTKGRLNPHIGRKFALADFAEALSTVRDGKAKGRIIIEVKS